MNLPCLPQKRLTLFLASPLRPFWVPLPRFRVANYGLRIERIGGTRESSPREFSLNRLPGSWFSGCGKYPEVDSDGGIGGSAQKWRFSRDFQAFRLWPLNAGEISNGRGGIRGGVLTLPPGVRTLGRARESDPGVYVVTRAARET